MSSPILAIDQGTTSTRAVLYDAQGQALACSQKELAQHYPQPGWVEHDPEEIWSAVAHVVAQALASAGIESRSIAAVGIANQRETVVIWDRKSGTALTPAVVWQDRRGSSFCRERRAEEPWIFRRTGLVLDPYFSATKLRWLLEEDATLKDKALAGQVACGTIDSWLLWRLTGGRVHATDVTNASRTLLLDLATGRWDAELCRFFSVPEQMLPAIRWSSDDFGTTAGLTFLPDGIPITGVAGDQQAALFGQRAFADGEAKCTYGTGAFFLVHTGDRLVHSQQRLLTTVAASIDNRLAYALEGSVFVAGAAVQWLRDSLRLFRESADVEALAAQSDPDQPVLFVPGFVGLGSPHWAPDARGVLFGLTRGTTAADLGRAALEGVAFQVNDLLTAAGEDAGRPLQSLRVDGGMARNALFLQCQADLAGIAVLQAVHAEATALGAAFLAGLRVGFWPSVDALRHLPQELRRFEPRLPAAVRQRRLAQWHRAVKAVIDFYASSGP
jgi:glycerol kinase